VPFLQVSTRAKLAAGAACASSAPQAPHAQAALPPPTENEMVAALLFPEPRPLMPGEDVAATAAAAPPLSAPAALAPVIARVSE
jgi:hypothetical protein